MDLNGEFNGDGFDDIIIGSTSTNQTFVVFGHAGAFPANIDASALSGSTGFIINGVTAGDQSAFAVTFTGDLNADGYDDIAIGAPFRRPGGTSNAGVVYVLYGSATAPSSPFPLSSLDGTNGFTLTGELVGSRAGYTLDQVGDYNLDGRDDFAIGAPVYYGAASQGGPIIASSSVYVVYGRDGIAATTPLSTVTGSLGVKYAGGYQDQMGWSLAGIGDVNDDGRADLGFTSFYSASVGFSGQASSGHLRFGPPDATVDASVNWQIDEDGLGTVAASGDFNGDGMTISSPICRRTEPTNTALAVPTASTCGATPWWFTAAPAAGKA